MQDAITYLGPKDVVEDQPFAHPNHIIGDVNSLRYMVDQLCSYLEMPQFYADRPRPIIEHRPSPEKYIYRLVIPKPRSLLDPRELLFVGFLGQRRHDADLSAAAEFDRILIDEIPLNSGLLSYSTMELICGNFSNLVVFANEEAKQHWGRSQAHAQAVGKLAPGLYQSIRLYNGLLPNGLSDSCSLRLTRIKYFSYQTDPWWRAVREFPMNEPNGQKQDA
jgi:hypothetical protein